jgi:3-methyladenine DNA glycosylase AlkD
MTLNVEKYRKLLELEIGKLPRKNVKITQDFRDLDLQYLGILHTHLRKLEIEEIYLLSLEDQFEIYTYCFHTSQIFEVLSYILMQLDSLELSFLFDKKEDLIKLSYDIEHWIHSDLISKIYANLIEYKRVMLMYFSEFAKNGSLWQRRLSLTSLIYYSAQRSTPLQFDIVAQKIKILLSDEEYYVQKAVGWTLRELYNLYPKDTENFLEIYIKDISSIAFQAATEKIENSKKEEFKILRKNSVSNPDEFEKKPAFERL